jgi:Sin3 binding region of histone deacetylase complex subunit SAP30
VLEYPTGAESEFSEDLEPPAPAPPNNSEASPAAPPRRREPSPGGYSPDRQPTLHEELVLAQKTQDRKLSLRRTAAGPRINLSRLSIETLRRYRTVYQLPDAGPNATREQLLDAVARHFSSIQVDEMSVIRHFLAAVRRQGQEQDGSGR